MSSLLPTVKSTNEDGTGPLVHPLLERFTVDLHDSLSTLTNLHLHVYAPSPPGSRPNTHTITPIIRGTLPICMSSLAEAVPSLTSLSVSGDRVCLTLLSFSNCLGVTELDVDLCILQDMLRHKCFSFPSLKKLCVSGILGAWEWGLFPSMVEMFSKHSNALQSLKLDTHGENHFWSLSDLNCMESLVELQCNHRVLIDREDTRVKHLVVGGLVDESCELGTLFRNAPLLESLVITGDAGLLICGGPLDVLCLIRFQQRFEAGFRLKSKSVTFCGTCSSVSSFLQTLPVLLGTESCRIRIDRLSSYDENSPGLSVLHRVFPHLKDLQLLATGEESQDERTAARFVASLSSGCGPDAVLFPDLFSLTLRGNWSFLSYVGLADVIQSLPSLKQVDFKILGLDPAEMRLELEGRGSTVRVFQS